MSLRRPVSLDQREGGQRVGRPGSLWGRWGGLSKDLGLYLSLKSMQGILLKKLSTRGQRLSSE